MKRPFVDNNSNRGISGSLNKHLFSPPPFSVKTRIMLSPIYFLKDCVGGCAEEVSISGITPECMLHQSNHYHLHDLAV